jgi:hypothetical protein
MLNNAFEEEDWKKEHDCRWQALGFFVGFWAWEKPKLFSS